jgi:ferredoxin-type protein NapG
MTMDTRISRRQLFRLDVGHILDGLNGRDRADSGQPSLLRPPGASSDEAVFVKETCDSCRECSQACPFGVISHVGPENGRAEGTPVIDPAANPCRWCADMDCVRACPSGVLAFGDDESVAPIGKAVLDLLTCLTRQGTLCDECVTVCPGELKAMRSAGREPMLDVDRCVGCGLCVFHCPSSPTSIHVTPAATGLSIGGGHDDAA